MRLLAMAAPAAAANPSLQETICNILCCMTENAHFIYTFGQRWQGRSRKYVIFDKHDPFDLQHFLIASKAGA